MRGAILFAGGLILGVATTAVVMRTLPERGSPDRPELDSGASGRDRRVATLEDELRDVRSKLAAMERSRSPARPDPGPGAPAPPEAPIDLDAAARSIDVEELMSALYQDRGRWLSKLVSDLLARERDGFPVLEEFLRRVASGRQGLAIFRRPKLAMPLLGVLFTRELDVAALAEFILERESMSGQSYRAQMELLDYLAAFLAWDADRHPALRERVAERLTWMLENPDRNFPRVLSTLRSLGVKADTEVLQAIISNPDHELYHRAAIHELARRESPEAVATLREFVAGHAGRPESASLEAALHALARMREPSAVAAFDDFMQASDPVIRESAVLVYFSIERDVDSLPLALELLNAGVDDGRKRSLVWQLSSVNPELLESIHTDSGAIEDPDIRGFVERTMRGSQTEGGTGVDQVEWMAIEEGDPVGDALTEDENLPTDR